MENSGHQPYVYVTREVEFAAAHRLARPELSQEENQALYGPCANPNGHGHNYRLEATFGGPIDPDTQMVVHFNQLKALLNELVVYPLDHRNLNLDVDFLKDCLPSSENIVVRLWERIEKAIPKDAPWELRRLKLSASDRNHAEYFGPRSPKQI